jgi:hypothetical protein
MALCHTAPPASYDVESDGPRVGALDGEFVVMPP